MTLRLDQIQIRDPFVLSLAQEGVYYLYGSTDTNVWDGPAVGFDCYRSTDLKNWEGPLPAFRPGPEFWADKQFWAPEVHEHLGSYYMFATFKADGVRRGTQVLVSATPQGPFEPHSAGPVTPSDWECLDGTLHIDQHGTPWMVFCHEWLQVKDGTVCAVQLSLDLKEAVGEPLVLFRASEAPWAQPISTEHHGLVHVTDGPFVLRAISGELLMLWASFHGGKYAQGIAVSDTGQIQGPWRQIAEPLYQSDGGHGMIFETQAGALTLTLHSPNDSPNERARFIPLQLTGTELKTV